MLNNSFNYNQIGSGNQGIGLFIMYIYHIIASLITTPIGWMNIISIIIFSIFDKQNTNIVEDLKDYFDFNTKDEEHKENENLINSQTNRDNIDNYYISNNKYNDIIDINEKRQKYKDKFNELLEKQKKLKNDYIIIFSVILIFVGILMFILTIYLYNKYNKFYKDFYYGISSLCIIYAIQWLVFHSMCLHNAIKAYDYMESVQENFNNKVDVRIIS
jgi:hypothetical protein